MSINIEGKAVGRISIVDDDRAVRQSYEMSVQELGLQPLNEAGPLGSLDEFAPLVPARADAAVCDFKLRVKKYAGFDGAALVARWYDAGFPALLCTKYDRASADEIRRFRCAPAAQNCDIARLGSAFSLSLPRVTDRIALGGRSQSP